MKKIFLFTVLAGVMPFSMMAQDDDLYFVPKKKAEVNSSYQNMTEEKPVYYSGSNRNVDEYNRYGNLRSRYQMIGTDSLGNDIIEFQTGKGIYPDTTYYDDRIVGQQYNIEDDYPYSREFSRFDGYYGPYDPWFYGYRWWGYSPYWHGWYDPWYAGWYGWYDPWYYGYYGWGYPYYWHGPRVTYVSRQNPRRYHYGNGQFTPGRTTAGGRYTTGNTVNNGSQRRTRGFNDGTYQVRNSNNSTFNNSPSRTYTPSNTNTGTRSFGNSGFSSSGSRGSFGGGGSRSGGGGGFRGHR